MLTAVHLTGFMFLLLSPPSHGKPYCEGNSNSVAFPSSTCVGNHWGLAHFLGRKAKKIPQPNRDCYHLRVKPPDMEKSGRILRKTKYSEKWGGPHWISFFGVFFHGKFPTFFGVKVRRETGKSHLWKKGGIIFKVYFIGSLTIGYPRKVTTTQK